jgi:NADH:ubiquinone oxidoreductase subunit 6 (subunit J)
VGQEIAAGIAPESSLIIDAAFWIIALSAIGSSIAVVQTRDLFRAALFLAAAFLSIAGLFVMLRAEFLAVVQVLIYVGAISVLIIFAVLTTRDVEHGNPSNMLRIPAAILALIFLLVASLTVLNTDWNLLSASEVAAMAQSGVEGEAGGKVANPIPRIAELLLQDYVLAFEVASVLLLATIVGALVLVRRGSG